MTDTQTALVLSGVSITVALLTLVWSAVWSIWLYRNTQRPKLRVTASPAFAATHDDTVMQLVSVAIVNTGAVPLTVTSVALRICDDPQKQQLLPVEWLQGSLLPKRLEVGEHFQPPFAERGGLRTTLGKAFPRSQADSTWTLVAVATDATGTKYESARVTI